MLHLYLDWVTPSPEGSYPLTGCPKGHKTSSKDWKAQNRAFGLNMRTIPVIDMNFQSLSSSDIFNERKFNEVYYNCFDGHEFGGVYTGWAICHQYISHQEW